MNMYAQVHLNKAKNTSNSNMTRNHPLGQTYAFITKEENSHLSKTRIHKHNEESLSYHPLRKTHIHEHGDESSSEQSTYIHRNKKYRKSLDLFGMGNYSTWPIREHIYQNPIENHSTPMTENLST